MKSVSIEYEGSVIGLCNFLASQHGHNCVARVTITPVPPLTVDTIASQELSGLEKKLRLVMATAFPGRDLPSSEALKACLDEARNHVSARNDVISAIKCVREATGLGLRDAKVFVEDAFRVSVLKPRERS